MLNLMLITSLILIICIISTKAFYKLGVPMLLVFIGLGMLFGSDGLVGIYFDNYDFTRDICSLALVFIMFYGGFGTNWNMAKQIALPAVLMSSLGVLFTAILTGVFCHIFFNITLLEGLLIGSVVASTDSASVFAILRAQKLNLKSKLASLLEVESGSNDPMAYMLTITIVSIMANSSKISIINTSVLIISQILIGILTGVILAKITIFLLRNANFEIEGFYTIFVTAISILAYPLAEILGGNGYLSVYISGLIIGNSSRISYKYKKSIFEFFDGISWIMQITLFFMLGLLSFPSKLPSIVSTGVVISLFMIFIARPLTTFIILNPFKFDLKEKLLISWVGLRGAGSVVFAIFAITYGVDINFDIFHTIFFIALFSVGVQGSLIPKVANVLGLVNSDDNDDVLKTFTDYAGEISTDIEEVAITKTHPLKDKTIGESEIPYDIFIVMIKRNDKIIMPKGSTYIREGDILVVAKSVEENKKEA